MEITSSEIEKKISQMETEIKYGNREKFNVLYEAYLDYLLSEKNGEHILWEEKNENLLNRHVQISDYSQD